MIKQRKLSPFIWGLAVFGLACLYFWWLAGDVFVFSGDEGIYLEGGRRVALGEVPYRDFFVLTGPLTFWLEGLLARWSGISLAVMRIPMVLDTAFLVWAVYWITSRFTPRLFSTMMALSFLVYESRLGKLNVNHRWDSSALATAAAVVALEAARRGNRFLWLLSGLLAASAAWATPSVLIVALPLLVWAGRQSLRDGWAFVAGGALVTAPAAAYLAYTGALVPLIQSMLWTGANYTGANRTTYGKVVMLAMSSAQDIRAVKFSESILASSYVLLAALTPLVALLGWGWHLRGKGGRQEASTMLPLMGVVAALALSAWPRWTADELLYTAAFSWAMCAVLFHRRAPRRLHIILCGMVLLAAAQATFGKVYAAFDLWTFETRVGPLRGTAEDRDYLEPLERRIQPGDTLFSFPYLPEMCFFLNAHNPTRYTFVQPGMMNSQDEARVLSALEATPPRWVIFENVPAAAILLLWPGSDPARIPMRTLNGYLEEHYRQVEVVDGKWGRLVIKERVPAPPRP